jgi:peptidyl-prolyl cis-trans isomerase B (cyclophilin B)
MEVPCIMKILMSLIFVIIAVVLIGCGGPAVSINRGDLDFGSGETFRTFYLANGGSGNMTWNLSVDSKWMSVMPSLGKISKDSVLVVVKVDRSQISPGKYTGKVNIISDGGDTTVVVTVIKLENPIVELVTSMGNIKLELFPDVAPIHVENFMNLIKQDFYSDLIWHRIIDGFMIQTGGWNVDGIVPPPPTIALEVNDSLHHVGSLGMARRQQPNTAASQFYICLTPQPNLDGKYTVFGKTIEGFDVVQAIGKVKTLGRKADPMRPDTPVDPVFLHKIDIIVDYNPDL